MDAIRKIEELTALAERLKLEAQIHAGEARSANATIAEIYQLCTGATGEPGNWHGAEPVRQALASKEAELAAREAEIANQALNYVSLFGELQNAMAEIERVRSLTDAQIDDLWIRRDCIEAIQAGDICAQVRCVVRAALTQQPTKD